MAEARRTTQAIEQQPDEGISEWERKRRMVLIGAAQVFAERGFDRGTTKEIAERVGLSQPSVYHYASSKGELLSELVKQVSDDFERGMAEALAASNDPVEQLRRIIRSFADVVSLDHKAFVVFWKEYDNIPTETRNEVDQRQRRYIKQVDAVVRALQKQEVLPANHPTHLVREGILGMLTWLHWWYVPNEKYTPERIAEAWCDLIGLPPAR